ncbi:MAG TPA: hypothetical protein EYP71_01755 [Dehalococcoidia bacterium]|nr:hypothetical protein [Dehalococcoidia bacterium]
MFEKKCPLCNQDNPDVLEDHLVAFSGDHGYPGPSIIVRLCVNCNRAIHRCSWTLVSEESEAVITRYLSFLEATLPLPLFQVLREELLAAKESVALQYGRIDAYELGAESRGKKCILCGCTNPDFLEEHDTSAWSQQAQLVPTTIMDVCANCHRVIVKFFEKKRLPVSEQSKTLLQKYLACAREVLSEQIRNELASFLGL